MRNAIIYTRVSTNEQADKGFSLPHQKEVLLRYCHHKELNVVKHYQEDYSAKTFDRPAFNQLLTFVKANKRSVDVLLFTRWDRFSRNTEEAYRIIRMMREMGIEVNSMEQPLDMSQPDSKIMLAIYLTVPEVENDKISIRTKEGSRKARKEGCWTGTAPFGYQNARNQDERSTLIPSKKAPLVKEAFETYAKGIYSIDAVRKMLRLKGLTISKNQFLNIIRNPVYKGKVFVSEWKKEKEQIVEGLHDGIIDEELFDTVQDIIKGKARVTRKPRAKNENLPLRRHLKCPRCGNNMTGSGSTSRDKTKHYYYHCQKGCKERVKVNLMHEEFNTFLNDLTIEKEVADLYRDVLSDVYKSNEGDRKKKIQEVENEVHKIKQIITDAEDRLFEGKLDLETFKISKNRFEKKMNELNYEKEEIKSLDSDLMNQLDFSLYLFQNLDKLYENSSYEIRQELLGSIFPEKLVFSKNKYRTTHLNNVLALIVSSNKGFKRNKKGQKTKKSLLPNMAPPLGLEPRTL